MASCLCAANLCAKTVPELKESNTAAADNVVKSATLRLPIAARHPNRICVEGSKIVRFIADLNQATIQHDTDTGSIFVIANTAEPVSIFVISEEGKTFCLTLSPKERLNAQNIEIPTGLKSKKAVDPVFEALPFEEKIASLIQKISELDEKTAHQLHRKPITVGSLKAKSVLSWEINGLTLEKWLVTNDSNAEVELNEAQFWTPGVLAVATEYAYIGAKGSTAIYKVRRSES